MRTAIRLSLAAGLALALPVGAGAVAAGASGVSAATGTFLSYGAATQAPVMQGTEDEPTAQFHPEGEGDYDYSFASLNPSGGFALSSLVWPGSAAGNAGSLAVVLGAPGSATALNDPVRAQATSGTDQTQQNTSAPSGSQMYASVVPPNGNDEESTATANAAGGSLGPAGSTGSSSSTSTILFDGSSDVLTATASNLASGMSIAAGVVSIGSVTSFARAVATGGSPPVLSGDTVVQNMKIAGQPAYVDGSGVHVGSPGHPAGPVEQAVVNTALAGAGMEIYFTAPQTITVGQVSYYYAASVLFYWAPPGDSSHNSFTMTLGGSAVYMATTAGLSGLSTVPGPAPASPSDVPTPTPAPRPQPTSAHFTQALVATPATTLSEPTGAATRNVATKPQLTSPVTSPAVTSGSAPVLASSTHLPGGLGVGWWILIFLGAGLGAALLTRVPALTARAAGAQCPYGAPTVGRGRSRP